MFPAEIAAEGPYKATMDGMRLRLQKLWEEDDQAQKIRAEKLELQGWDDFKGVLLHQGRFGIEKTCGLVARKYYWETLRRDVDVTIDFVTGLPISTDWEGNSYDSILIIVRMASKDGTPRAGADNYRCTRAGSRLYTFQAQLRLSPTHILRRRPRSPLQTQT